MTPTKHCDLCDTMLEFEQDGQRFVFTYGHTPEDCHALTKHRIANLKQALVDQQTSFERHLRSLTRDVDKLLADEGLPTLTERRRRRDAVMLMALARIEPSMFE